MSVYQDIQLTAKLKLMMPEFEEQAEVLAEARMILYRAQIAAGFTEDQALKIVMDAFK